MDIVLNATRLVYRLKYKWLLTALVMGLLLRVLLLVDEGTINLLSPERRIVLVLFALRLLMMLHENIKPQKSDMQPYYPHWQARIPLFVLMVPPMIVFWLVAWSTGGQLHRITSYAIAVSIINLLLIVNLIITLVQPAKRTSAGNQVVTLPYTTTQFLMDIMFYGAFGLIFTFGMIGLMVLSSGALDDIIAIGGLTFNVYLLIWGVQGVFWFCSNLIRQTAKEM